ncbi:aminotransferase class III-fold pyridoxal phosphate-dependent enzyme [Micromonospora sp. DT46]|uniref:aminotransferase class III-fold pyridoxal phosphate-dependent enzyme n=1 Tax=Micromonospora sp. DT46 TaxID=3393435 RepID=UPI003CF968FD
MTTPQPQTAPLPSAGGTRLLAARQGIPPVPWSHAAGSWIHAADGRRFLDGASGLVCVNIGHAHPVVTSAIADQLARGTFASPGTLTPRLQTRLAETIAVAVGRPGDLVGLTTSGTSAVELAIAIARSAQRARGEEGRHGVLTASLGYHGNSAFALALSGHGRRRPHPDDGFGVAPAFDPPYPGLHAGCRFEVCRAECADAVEEAILTRGANRVAAVLLEPVNGTTGGGYVPPAGYLAAVRAICDRHGVLLIYDEVLTGLGRTGLPLAADHEPASRPDIVVLAKGLAAGFVPLAAVLIAPELGETVLSGGGPLPIMGTMSATPLQARAGLAVLSVLGDIGALDPTTPRGTAVDAAVRDAAEGSPLVLDVRGKGYFHGVELTEGTQPAVLARARAAGLLLYPFNGFRRDGTGEGVIVAPPLTISHDENDFLRASLRTALSAAA